MWWITDNGGQWRSVGVSAFGTTKRSHRRTLRKSGLKQKRLTLPVNAAQAAANLVLQESGVSGQAEAPLLRKDIRCLESALRRETKAHRELQEALELLRGDYAYQLARLDECKAELAFMAGLPGYEDQHAAECSHWLVLAADHGQNLMHALDETHESQQRQISTLRSRVSDLESEEQRLAAALNGAGQEQSELVELVTELKAYRRGYSEANQKEIADLQQRLEQSEQMEKSDAQQLKIKVVTQAAEIRSLKQELAKVTGEAVPQVSDDPMLPDPMLPDTTLWDDPTRIFCNAEESEHPTEYSIGRVSRLEASLAAVRTELDAAVHELNYANAESERLRNEVGELEALYDVEISQTVQIAELHSLNASLLEEQVQDMGCGEVHFRHMRTEQEAVIDKLRGKIEKMSNALEDFSENQNTHSLTAHSMQLEIVELREANEAVEELKSVNAELNGSNHRLSLLNESLTEQLARNRTQSEEATLRQSTIISELQQLVEHHERASDVTRAESDLVAGQFEEQRMQFQKTVDQRDKAIECLKVDLQNFRTRTKDLESALEGEEINRTIAEQETQRLSLERSDRIAFLSREREQLQKELKRLRDELDGQGGDRVRSAA